MEEAEFRNRPTADREAELMAMEMRLAARAVLQFRDTQLQADIAAEIAKAYADGIEQCALWLESQAREVGWDFVEGRHHRWCAEQLRRLKP